jgi:hypothetical protein
MNEVGIGLFEPLSPTKMLFMLRVVCDEEVEHVEEEVIKKKNGAKKKRKSMWLKKNKWNMVMNIRKKWKNIL